jgi:two-component system phosphate regulon response regulator PhoB
MITKAKILVVEDEEDILELIRYNLTREGYEVFCATSGEEALEKTKKHKPKLLILDWMLPGIDGLEVCRHLKSNPETQGVLILMLTAKGEEVNVVTGLEIGADEYMTKPFSPRVLLARLKSMLRRKMTEVSEEKSLIEIPNAHLSIHPGKREVLLHGKPLALTFAEFQALHFMARRPGWVFTRYQIVDGVRGEEYAVTERAVDVLMVGLRKKLGMAGKNIETVRGVGYRFRAYSA